MTFEVIVQLKPEVLSPEGRAIQETMGRLGFSTLSKVAVAKRYLLEFEEQETQGQILAEQVAREYLANPVSETFTVKRL